MSDEAAATETELDAARVAELIEAGAEIVDVRRPYEYEGGRIEGSRNVEMNALPASAESISRDRPVVFVCRSGNRSGMARDAFREAGYDAYNLAGGMEAWAEAGLPLDPPDGEVRSPLPAS
ncbi:MAG: rhodanese-like domain-containing protein [Solirubrobacterales bacterium]